MIFRRPRVSEARLEAVEWALNAETLLEERTQQLGVANTVIARLQAQLKASLAENRRLRRRRWERVRSDDPVAAWMRGQ
jgi:hypothetical protein